MLIPETEPHVSIDKIKWRQYPLRELKTQPHNHQIIGWDTETFKGYARLIANSYGKTLFIAIY